MAETDDLADVRRREEQTLLSAHVDAVSAIRTSDLPPHIRDAETRKAHVAFRAQVKAMFERHKTEDSAVIKEEGHDD